MSVRRFGLQGTFIEFELLHFCLYFTILSPLLGGGLVAALSLERRVA